MTSRDAAQFILTAAIIARDEERTIGDCLRSLGWADEVLVVLDGATTDRTQQVAEALGARVEKRTFENFAKQREYALSLALGEWVLFVDADERVTDELRSEISRVLSAAENCAGYWIPRDNQILGRQIRTMGWYPDYQLRLLQRGAAHFDPRRIVHEVPVLNGPAGHLRAPLVHLSYTSIREFVRRQDRYCALEAQRWLGTFGRPRRRSIVGQPIREFFRRFVLLKGYQEGWRGLILSTVLAWYAGKAIRLARRFAESAALASNGPL